MKAIILILTFVTLFGCSSDDSQEQFNFDVGFEFSVTDNEGNDLLNPENPNSFNESDIKLFYLINGETVEFYDDNLDYPRNFLIYQNSDSYRIRVFLNYSETEELPETYIQWSKTDSDTIKSEINRSDTYVKIQKVLLNDNIIWNSSDNSEPYYQIVK